MGRVASECSLERLGKERGARGEPPKTSALYHGVEGSAIERIEVEKTSAHGLLLDELNVYSERRLSGLDFEGTLRDNLDKLLQRRWPG